MGLLTHAQCVRYVKPVKVLDLADEIGGLETIMEKILDLARQIKTEMKWELPSGICRRIVILNFEWGLEQQDSSGEWKPLKVQSLQDEGSVDELLVYIERWARLELEKAGYYPEPNSYENGYIVSDGSSTLTEHHDYLHALLLAVWKIKEADNVKPTDENTSK